MRPLRRLGQLAFGTRYGFQLWRRRRAVLAHLDGRAGPPMPAFVQLQLTHVCDLRCKMCGQWGETGVFLPDRQGLQADSVSERQRVRELIGRERQMGIDEHVRLLDQLVGFRPIVGLFGGEPLLYPEIVRLVREVKSRRLTLTIITNGGLLEHYAEDLVRAGVDSIAVSFDGPPELHDEIRGRRGSFERAAAGIRAIVRSRNSKGRALPIVFGILPVTELNFRSIGPAVDELSRLPLEAINIGLRWFVPKEVGAQYESVMRDAFGVEARSWKGFEFAWPDGPAATSSPDMVGLVRLLKGLRRRRLRSFVNPRQAWLSFVPDVQPVDVPSFLTDHKPTFGHDMCPAPWFFAQVLPDGEVVVCGDFPDYSLGNVRKAPFSDVWLGPKAQAFREKLAKEPLPICNRCCGLYVHGRWKRPRAQQLS